MTFRALVIREGIAMGLDGIRRVKGEGIMFTLWGEYVLCLGILGNWIMGEDDENSTTEGIGIMITSRVINWVWGAC